jgi:hypothetical protein
MPSAAFAENTGHAERAGNTPEFAFRAAVRPGQLLSEQ